MLDQLESNYNCANASADLHQLKQALEEMKSRSGNDASPETQDELNRLENQIHFIQNKCDIH
jgi:ElaB/YqjD/DUF883 family membrane-anchored ribosome-binding protein